MHTVGSTCLFSCAQIFHFRGKRSRCIFWQKTTWSPSQKVKVSGQPNPAALWKQEMKHPGVSQGRESQGESHHDKCCNLMDRDTSLMMSLPIYFLPPSGDLWQQKAIMHLSSLPCVQSNILVHGYLSTGILHKTSLYYCPWSMAGEHGPKEEAATQTICSLKVTNMIREGELMGIRIRLTRCCPVIWTSNFLGFLKIRS